MPFAELQGPREDPHPEAEGGGFVTRTTELYVEIYGERARNTTMVLVEEVADGGWASPATC